MFMYGGTTTERLKTLYPVNAALWLRFSLLMLLKPQPYFHSSPLLDAVAHVGFGGRHARYGTGNIGASQRHA